MTDEARRAYRREWYQRNKEKVKEYKHRSAIRRALQEIESGKVKLVTKMELQADGQETAS